MQFFNKYFGCCKTQKSPEFTFEYKNITLINEIQTLPSSEQITPQYKVIYDKENNNDKLHQCKSIFSFSEFINNDKKSFIEQNGYDLTLSRLETEDNDIIFDDSQTIINCAKLENLILHNLTSLNQRRNQTHCIDLVNLQQEQKNVFKQDLYDGVSPNNSTNVQSATPKAILNESIISKTQNNNQIFYADKQAILACKNNNWATDKSKIIPNTSVPSFIPKPGKKK